MYLSFSSYHITWNTWRALKKQQQQQISFSQSNLKEINFNQVRLRVFFFFLNLVTRWPAEPGGPVLPGRPGNPGTPSVPEAPCYIKA